MSIRERLDQVDPAGPRLVLSESELAVAYRRLERALPTASIHYATKSNPAEPVLRKLHALGSGFEVASARELALLAALGVAPRKVIFSAPVKAPRDVVRAHQLGVRRYVVDSTAEVEKIAALAPGASVLVRVAVDDHHSRWPLGRKFGAATDEVPWLCSLAGASGLVVDGLAFHVGSQATDAAAWRAAVQRCGELAASAELDGVRLRTLDVGGGIPVPYEGGVATVTEIAEQILLGLERWPYEVALVVEPGRYLVAQAGTIEAHVIGLSERAGRHWAFLDVGAFNGLFEASAVGGGLSLPFRAPDLPSEPSRTYEVAGPTCDGDDVIGTQVPLPAGLAVGDVVEIGCAGAYSLSYASEFCGAPPLEVVSEPEVVLDLRGEEPVIDLRERREELPHARIVEPGDPLFEAAAEQELRFFEELGYVDADGGLDDFRSYDATSSFIVVPDAEGLAAVLRLIWPNRRGFKTVNDFTLTDEGARVLADVGEDRIVEIGTLAVRPDVRGLDVAICCYNVARRESWLRGCTAFLVGIDDGLLEVYRTQFHFPFVALSESDPDYYGSPCTAALLDHLVAVPEMVREAPELYRQIFLAPVGEPVTTSAHGPPDRA